MYLLAVNISLTTPLVAILKNKTKFPNYEGVISKDGDDSKLPIPIILIIVVDESTVESR